MQGDVHLAHVSPTPVTPASSQSQAAQVGLGEPMDSASPWTRTNRHIVPYAGVISPVLKREIDIFAPFSRIGSFVLTRVVHGGEIAASI
jgi:hypothetical protein